MRDHISQGWFQGVREVIPHIGPIPIIIPLKLFLEATDFSRIMLPRALRGSFVGEERSKNMSGLAGECEMKTGFLLLLLLLFCNSTWINRHQGKKISDDSNLGSKRKKDKADESLVSLSGDSLERDEHF